MYSFRYTSGACQCHTGWAKNRAPNCYWWFLQIHISLIQR